MLWSNLYGTADIIFEILKVDTQMKGICIGVRKNLFQFYRAFQKHPVGSNNAAQTSLT